MYRFVIPISVILLAIIVFPTDSLLAQLPSGWRAHDLNRPAPTVIDPGEASKPSNIPSDAVVLFDGTDLSKWKGNGNKEAAWKIVDGAMESVPGSGFVYSKDSFGDCQLHVEWAAPSKPKGNGQGRGNSGVFLMGEFEIQVLDSFENATYADGSAGSLYGQHPPLVNACRKPGEWQTYDIIFTAPKFEDDKLVSPARMTVLHNGVLIHNNIEAYGPTAWIQKKDYPVNKTEGPISFQDHGNPVRYRNVWVRSLGQPAATKEYPAVVELSAGDAAKYVGSYGGKKVEFKDGELTIKNFGSKLKMVYQGDDTFGFKFSAGEMKFEMVDDTPKSVTVKVDAAGTKTFTRDKE